VPLLDLVEDPATGVIYDPNRNVPPFRPCSGAVGEPDSRSGIECPLSGLIDAFGLPVIGLADSHEGFLADAVRNLLQVERGGGESFSLLFEDNIERANELVTSDRHVTLTDALDSLTICTPTAPEPVVPSGDTSGIILWKDPRPQVSEGGRSRRPFSRKEKGSGAAVVIGTDPESQARVALHQWLSDWAGCAASALIDISRGFERTPVPQPEFPSLGDVSQLITCILTPSALPLGGPLQTAACLAMFGSGVQPPELPAPPTGVRCICL